MENSVETADRIMRKIESFFPLFRNEYYLYGVTSVKYYFYKISKEYAVENPQPSSLVQELLLERINRKLRKAADDMTLHNMTLPV